MDIQSHYSWHRSDSCFHFRPELLMGFTQPAECSVSLANGAEREADR
jgi:hypothetical protein